jgi:hypothetical protein
MIQIQDQIQTVPPTKHQKNAKRKNELGKAEEADSIEVRSGQVICYLYGSLANGTRVANVLPDTPIPSPCNKQTSVSPVQELNQMLGQNTQNINTWMAAVDLVYNLIKTVFIISLRPLI